MCRLSADDTNFRSWTLILNSKKDICENKLVLMCFRNYYNRELLRSKRRRKSLFLILRQQAVSVMQWGLC